MMHPTRTALFLLAAIGAGPLFPQSAIAEKPTPGQQVAASATIRLDATADSAAQEKSVRYWLFLPANDESATEPAPLLLFLHGSGERGDDLNLVKKHGPPKFLDDANRAASWPFITVSPQCDQDVRWNAAELAKLIDHVANTCRVDRRRIYVTGLSMGGSGTWDLLAAQPGRFAAAIPICGKGDPAAAEKLATTPTWIFVGDKDKAETVENCQQMEKAITAAGGMPKITVYPDVGHDAWTATYNDPAVWEWLAAQRLK
jgi:predicted peptidase